MSGTCALLGADSGCAGAAGVASGARMESSCRCRRLSTFLAYLALTPTSVARMTAASSTSAATFTCTGQHCFRGLHGAEQGISEHMRQCL